MKRSKIHRPDESSFIARLKAGDADAYEELVRLYSGRLIALARQILGDEDLAHDAVQDAFLNAFRAMDRFNGDARLSSWLHRIVMNAALAKLRVKRRRPESFYAEEFGIGADEDPLDRALIADPGDGPLCVDDEIARCEEAQFVQNCIARLKKNHRTVLTLRYIHEYDTEQTAKILGVGPNTVKTRLMRARGALRSHIEREVEHASMFIASLALESEQSQAA
ncbi:MAG: sigma-70 family RNA polymerase sigma factor [Deltaproteobacteria bacterium]|nr:sigma-70 family RNA polymerase sigma factor [Deltaproteobacteria bacterium]